MTTFSNHFTSQPLTAASLQRVVDEMVSQADAPLSVHPDVLIVPPGLIRETLHSARAAVERLAQRLGRPVATGRYEQRQRRRAQGVVAQRVQRQQQVERKLVEAIEFVELMESFGIETMP